MFPFTKNKKYMLLLNPETFLSWAISDQGIV